AQILTPENRDAVKNHADPGTVFSALSFLNDAHLLTQENFDAVVRHVSPGAVASALLSLKYAHILTQENFDAVKNHVDPDAVARALGDLNDAHILMQANLNALLSPENAYLLTPAARDSVWYRIPSHLFTQPVFNELIRCARQPNPEQQVRQYVDQVLGVRRDAAPARLVGIPAPVINHDGQSTHTASVHESVSESATKLWARYRDQLTGSGLDEAVEEVTAVIISLSDADPKTEAAKRCITRITDRAFVFTDRTSGISLRQLIALAYLAMTDEVNRHGSLEDARAQLVQGLYETQRGYNLSEAGIDDGQADHSICIAGTFNKLVEKLAMIHPDCEIKVITKTLATLKLPKVVEEEAMRYLATQVNSQTPEGLQVFIALIDRVKTEGVAVIWDHIKNPVADWMFDEFGSLYRNNKADPEFVAFVEVGRDMNLEASKLDALKEQCQRRLASQQPGSSSGNPTGFFVGQRSGGAQQPSTGLGLKKTG
ncbi:MAG TPA: hypothetical protein DIC51_05110, partial [Coxiellaceae bacterium]|nr:hypothetical protein [Coxiellaceae bacterium]